MWDERRAVSESYEDKTWCVVGDFNVVRCFNERRGANSQYATREMEEFNDFTEGLVLNDLPLNGRKFTWHRSNVRCMSRIDRFLLSDVWISRWQDLSQWGLKRTVLDHCPILLKATTLDWDPKLFRVTNCRLQHKDFEKMVAEKWGALDVV